MNAINCTAENMSRLLGSDCTDEQACDFAYHLISMGWELEMHDGYVDAFKGEEWMTESEWQNELAACFSK